MTKSKITSMTKAQAKALTKRILEAVDSVWALLLQAHEQGAWKALSYPTWEAYVTTEFGMARRNSYLLIDQGRAIRAIEEAVGENVQHAAQISQRDAQTVKHDLPAVTTSIKARVEQGENADAVIDDEIAKKRAQKADAKNKRAAEQVENDRLRDDARTALPDSIKRAEAAKAVARGGGKHTAIAAASQDDRIADLEEAVRVLEREAAALRADAEVFGPMRLQWERGGFKAVVDDKDEQIRVLRTRVETESRDKAGWKTRADFWQAEARKLGYSNDIVIPLNGGPQ